jgi:hypothetical protein
MTSEILIHICELFYTKLILPINFPLHQQDKGEIKNEVEKINNFATSCIDLFHN